MDEEFKYDIPKSDRSKPMDGFHVKIDNLGNEYAGEWKNGLKHNYGTLKYYNGDEYIGQFKNGL